ncbi:MAG: ABC transporter permease [Defluviitaleaceae bacterium]|nr:ABC transporter permease [Defluviitaleaceae bacterium]
MRLTAKLAYSQLKINRKRAVWTLLGIVLSTAMITAVFGFAASGMAAMYDLAGELRDVYNITIMGIGVILSAIIVASSIIVISNSFRVSAGERLSQFGILKSVGATKRQIAETIMYESLFLSAIGIPVGIITGLLVQFIGLEIANHFISHITQVDRSGFMFDFVIAWQAIIVSVAIGLITVLLSAWLPARKAAKIPAINAIRKVGDVKIKAKQVRSGWIVSKLFGFEGALASKSLKRSKRNFRATVVSLTISIVMFIAASSFGAHLNRMANLVLHMVDSNVIGSYYSSMTIYHTEDYEQVLTYWPISNETAELVTARLREFPDTTVMGVGSNLSSWRMMSTPVPSDMLTDNMRVFLDPENERKEFSVDFALITVDAEAYAELCRIAGVPLGSNILVNYFRRQIEGRWTEFTPFVFDYQMLTLPMGNEILEIPLRGELRYEQVPNEVTHASRGILTIIVPELDSKTYRWFAETDDINGFVTFMHEAFDELVPRDEDMRVNMHVRNLSREQESELNILRLIMVFIYGFVGMLTLIGLTNVISTISTNVRARAREFAVLQSVGMAHSGLNRMLNLESILCSVKSLIFGLPLGIAASWLVYDAMLASVYFSFRFPVAAVVQCIIAVFILTWVTMRYSAARLRGKNIVETIRSESGVGGV